jgi:glyoxylase-like metal-dependent hydrolase (beta-lactamase superfamily II)
MLDPATEARREETTAAYTVTAVRYGALRSRKSDLFYRFETYGEADAEAEMAYYFWLLQGGGETVLVDTGFDVAAGARRGRTCLAPPLEALEQVGVSMDAVSTVIVTHLHYDHIGNLDAFPDAALVVPRRELEFWTGPLARRRQFAAHVEEPEIARLQQAAARGRLRASDGDEQILPGVRAITVGGHSPGQQLVIVETGGRPVVLASDAVHLYEELDLDRPFAVIADLEAMYHAYDVLRALGEQRGAVIVPGHDPRVMERFPALHGGSDLAVRLEGEAVDTDEDRLAEERHP